MERVKKKKKRRRRVGGGGGGGGALLALLSEMRMRESIGWDNRYDLYRREYRVNKGSL